MEPFIKKKGVKKGDTRTGLKGVYIYLLLLLLLYIINYIRSNKNSYLEVSICIIR
ncbi:hypothetical protein vBSenM1_28 [Salmonella phage vB_SenM-1]|uniref:Uncharacterized protein n=1 Tax=Salmonella phage vB_SenM-1 TaxID=2732255 RepID=A0A6M4BH96_9CAUD|nr:hypothetical protein vBSenM1_28 [Salmonella phage vB_SenM-1]